MTWSSSKPLHLGVLVGALAAAGCGHGATGAGTAPTPKDKGVVSAESIDRQPAREVEKSLEGRFPGVVVTQTADGSLAVRIRGASSVYGNNEPLYVIDGMPIQAGPSGALTGINAHDIESIKVLKEPAETAIYGLRGANGVILIKTKGATRKP